MLRDGGTGCATYGRNGWWRNQNRLVEGEDPAESLFSDEWYNGLVEEGLDHAELETDAEQAARNQRRVLLWGEGGWEGG